ncbi:MAG: GldG family protein [Candidatus Shapirobacteria bacterium]|jgi:ABC-type uncharacterized transport system involved in gliding motility auxiliary subunit
MKKIVTLATGLNILIVVIVINVILTIFPFWRIDLTRSRIHSLSPATVKIIKGVKDVVNIKVFMTQNLPAEVKPVASNLKTILEEISRINQTKVRVTYLDPAKDNKLKQEAEAAGIQPIQFSSVESDKFEISQAYFGLIMEYGDQQEVLPVAGDIDNLEYILIASINRMVSESTPKIALAIDPTKKEETKLFREIVSRDYEVTEVQFSDKLMIASDAASLTVIGNPGKLGEKGSAEVRKWIEAKKGLIAFISRVAVDSGMQAKVNEESDLEKVLKEYGVEIEPKLVMDQSSAVANFRTQQGMFITQYLYWMTVKPENIDNSIPATSGISNVLLPWVSPIKISGKNRSILKSSQYNQLDETLTDLAPNSTKRIREVKDKQTVAAIESEDKKIAVVSSDDFIKDQFVYNNQQNLALALNLVDYLSASSDLLTIRSKNIKSSPIVVADDGTRIMIKVVNMVVPMILIITGAIIYRIIRSKRNKWWYEKANK